MKERTFLAIVIFLVLLMIGSLLTGCGSENNGQDQSSDVDICPDSLVMADGVALSSELDYRGEALGNQSVFTVDTTAIHATIRLSYNLCCTPLNISWIYDDEIIYSWQQIGTDDKYSYTSTLSNPGSNFAAGEYRIIVYVNIRMIFDITFTVQ